MHLSTLIILFLLVSKPVFAEIKFHFPDTEEARNCKKKAMEWIDETNKILPEGWAPDDFHVHYSGTAEFYQGVYKPVHVQFDDKNIRRVFEKMMALNNCEKLFFIHEYAHIVIDDLMRKQSPSWQYYISWRLIDFQDIDETKNRYIENIQTHRKRLEDLKSMTLSGDKEKWRQENIARTESLLSKNEEMVEKLTRAQQIQAQSPYPLNRLISEMALSPFAELFADTVTVLVLEDWSAFRKTLGPIFEKMRTHNRDTLNIVISNAVGEGGHRIKLPDEETVKSLISMILYHRDFMSGFSIESYPYDESEWKKRNPYFYFVPMRSWIRDTVDGNKSLSPTDMIQALGLGIIDIYEKELIPNPGNLKRSLLEQNQSLHRATVHHLPKF